MTTLEQRLNAGLLAEHADTAERHAGRCSLCRQAILSGQRHAVTVPAGLPAHVTCIAVAAAAPRRVPSIW